MANDIPKIHGITFTHAPKVYAVWESQLKKHTLANGQSIVYNMGYVLRGKLEWGEDGWVDENELSNIASMYNQLTASAKFYPRPDTEASTFYQVHITNQFDFSPYGGRMDTSNQSYQGSIEFESSLNATTATATPIW